MSTDLTTEEIFNTSIYSEEELKRMVHDLEERRLRGGSHQKSVKKHASNYTKPKRKPKNKRTHFNQK